MRIFPRRLEAHVATRVRITTRAQIRDKYDQNQCGQGTAHSDGHNIGGVGAIAIMDGGEAGGISAAESFHLHMADSDKSNSLIASKSLRHVEFLLSGAVVRHLLRCLKVGVLALVDQLNGLVLCQNSIINVKLI